MLQAGDHRYDVRSDADLPASGKARNYSTSLEGGKSFVLADAWSIEPQAQVMYRKRWINYALAQYPSSSGAQLDAPGQQRLIVDARRAR
ncbi:autotransporter domain-containing protein [Variovorax flavidus]|uniref:autotransporter domain-containing protein n=1 Tax=Variovorax flavidus TaxID=3053501 RepID=UPI003365807F